MSKSKSDSVLEMNQNRILNALDDDTERMWKLCDDQKLWLEGDKVELDGRKIDWSQFDFLMAITKFRHKDYDSHLTFLQRFWWTMYPHVETILNQLKNYETQFKTVMGIEDRTLKNYALQHLELVCYQKFFEEELGKYMSGAQAKKLKAAFHNYHREHEEESQRKIAEIKAQEDERKRKEEEKLAEQKREQERKAFERSLR